MYFYDHFFFRLLRFQNGVDIEIVRVLPESPSPNLANIFCNSTEADPSDMVRWHNYYDWKSFCFLFLFLFSFQLELRKRKRIFHLSLFVRQTITLDSDATPVFQIKTHRPRAAKIETSHYKVTVSRLRARMNIKLSYTTHKGEMMVEGYPDVSYLDRIFRLILSANCSFFETNCRWNPLIDPHCHEQHWCHQNHGRGRKTVARIC